MAVVTTTLVPRIVLNQFSEYFDVQDRFTIAARAEVLGIIQQGTVAATGVGDTSVLTFDIDLPRNFAYRVDKLSLMLDGSASADVDYEKTAQATVFDGSVVGNRSYRLNLGLKTLFRGSETIANPDSAEFQTIYQYGLAWSGILKTLKENDFIRCRYKLKCANTNTGAINVNLVARFLQYDINQAAAWIVNSPQPIQ